MFKRVIAIGLTAMLAVVIAVGVIAYSYLKPVEAASEPIAAIPIAQTSATSTTAGATTYTIDQASSQARFIIDETLNGQPVTVVGATNQVAGQIAVDPTNPTTAQIGTIQINARTFATDSENRDRAIQNRILETATYEYITFTPTTLSGLPESSTVGQSYSFQITGQLTIRDQTREATFAATVTPNADGTLQGTATTTINYADWGLSVPEVPIVTNLAQKVTLELDFVAKAN
jgi:polyisoprenoid-binding protein YceI